MARPPARGPGRARAHAGGIAAAVAIVALVWAGVLEPIELWALNRLFELRGPRPPSAPIVIVSIDESSMAELGTQWPFPRAMHGELLARISAGRPRAIGVDVIFDVPSSRGAADDAALARAVADAGNVVLAAAHVIDVQPGYVREDCNVPLKEIRTGAAAVAPVNIRPDGDGRLRRMPLRFACGGRTEPGFEAALHRLARASGLPGAELPDAAGILVNFRGGPRTYPWLSYYAVLRGEVPPAAFRDRIVLVGATSEVMHDVYPTAFARAGDMPGVEIHANALDTLLRGDRIREVPRWVSTAAAVVAGLLGAALVVRLHARLALVAVAGVWLVCTGLAYLGFVTAHVWMRQMAATHAILLGGGLTVIDSYIREQRDKRRLSQFFSPEVVREVVRQRDSGSLASHRRLVTVLFSDIRGFTTLSEQLEPEEVTALLHEYLTEMTEVVFRHGGTVDKYIGDCIMVLYNAPLEDPDHAVKAVRTAIDLQARAAEVSRRWEARRGVTIRCGVGINTGWAVVGTMGSRQRLEYSAIGDTVNLASRLESLTKDYGVPIIISASTREGLGGLFPTVELGSVVVKGKTKPVTIYSVPVGAGEAAVPGAPAPPEPAMVP